MHFSWHPRSPRGQCVQLCLILLYGLQYYFSATMLESVSDQLRIVNQMVTEAEAIVEERKRDLLPLKREWDQAEAVVKEAAQVQDLHDELAKLTVNYAWSFVYQQDLQIEQAEAQVEEVVKTKIPTIEERIQQAQVGRNLLNMRRESPSKRHRVYQSCLGSCLRRGLSIRLILRSFLECADLRYWHFGCLAS